MKRLNSYLLTHHPLLWNLRVHLIWPVMIVLHALYFIWGFCSARFPGAEPYARIRPHDEIVALSILLGILAAVWWLVMYFRNNAFKSFYPLQRGRLALETVLVFITALGLASISISYAVGKAMHIRQLSAGIDVNAERDVLTLAEPLLPFNLGDFSRFNACDSTEGQAGSGDTDRLPVDTFSYLHYCTSNSSGYDGRNPGNRLQPESRRDRVLRWLRNGERDSVRQILAQYLQLVKKYHGNYLFDPEAHVRSIFGSPNFEVRYMIIPYSISGNFEPEANLMETAVVADAEAPQGAAQAPRLKYGAAFAFIEARNPDDALTLIEEARDNVLGFTRVTVLLYIALSVTILVIGFRLTETRTWFIALIGAGLWMVVLALLLTVIRNEEGALTLVLFLEGGFTGLAVFGISSGWMRRRSGVLFLWSLAGMPFFMPFVWAIVKDQTAPVYPYDSAGKVEVVPAPFHDFLSIYQESFILINVGLSLLLILLFYIPMARKWQAMAEE